MKIIKGFDELRFIAAFGVLVHHLELYKKRDAMGSIYSTFLHDFIDGLGVNMVRLFFVISVFLITFLLLKEKSKTGRIDVKKFYMRRVLRIWPLYYLIILISFFILPYIPHFKKFFVNEDYYYHLILQTDYYAALPWFLLFFSNYALAFGYRVVGAAHSWSVSVEEQFYLFWPFVIKSFGKSLWKFLICLVIVKAMLDVLISSFISSSYIIKVYLFIKYFPIEYMALGALGAYFAFKKESLYHQFFKNKIVVVLTIIMLFLLVITNTYSFALGVVFTLLINVIYVNQKKIKETKIAYFGKISYGIYMYHPLIMFFVFAFLNNSIHERDNLLLYNLLLYGTTILLTLLISHLSFKYFEGYFLKIKGRFLVTTIKHKV